MHLAFIVLLGLMVMSARCHVEKGVVFGGEKEEGKKETQLTTLAVTRSLIPRGVSQPKRKVRSGNVSRSASRKRQRQDNQEVQSNIQPQAQGRGKSPSNEGSRSTSPARSPRAASRGAPGSSGSNPRSVKLSSRPSQPSGNSDQGRSSSKISLNNPLASAAQRAMSKSPSPNPSQAASPSDGLGSGMVPPWSPIPGLASPMGSLRGLSSPATSVSGPSISSGNRLRGVWPDIPDVHNRSPSKSSGGRSSDPDYSPSPQAGRSPSSDGHHLSHSTDLSSASSGPAPSWARRGFTTSGSPSIWGSPLTNPTYHTEMNVEGHGPAVVRSRTAQSKKRTFTQYPEGPFRHTTEDNTKAQVAVRLDGPEAHARIEGQGAAWSQWSVNARRGKARGWVGQAIAGGHAPDALDVPSGYKTRLSTAGPTTGFMRGSGGTIKLTADCDSEASTEPEASGHPEEVRSNLRDHVSPSTSDSSVGFKSNRG